jgi:hypothetical protein
MTAAVTNLEEQALRFIREQFPSKRAETARIVWWDDGGYLREVVQQATVELGVEFRTAEGFPLQLRKRAVEEEDVTDLQVWYVPESKNGRDWFRDVRETGGEIVCSIEELTAEIYDRKSWELFDAENADTRARDEAAAVILRQFSRTGRPNFEDLVGEIITKGGGQILEHILERGWPNIDRDDSSVRRVREQLSDRHGVPFEGDEGPEAVVERVRRWSVARSLILAGVDDGHFPDEFGAIGSLTNKYDYLEDILDRRGSQSFASIYLRQAFWPEVIAGFDDVWDYVECPVDGALDAALWDTWIEELDTGSFENCAGLAERRQDALAEYPTNSPWNQLWEQAAHMAKLKGYFEEWDSGQTDRDPFEEYTDQEDGSWRIDSAVLELELTGKPEDGLDGHPAADTLPERRSTLLRERYREYLDQLAEDVKTTMQVGQPLNKKRAAYRWWSEHEDEFGEAGSVAILLIDALRFDLAQQLADRLKERFDVRQETRLSVLPSETKFGMAALTPGRAYQFSVHMDGDTLTVERGGQRLDTKSYRKKELKAEGWAVPDDPEREWQDTHIAYYDKELDDVGEGEIGDIGSHFRDYIDDLQQLISKKLDKQGWDRLYVVTDHGFVLLPEGTNMEPVTTSYEQSEMKYRRVAGDAVEHSGLGVLLTPNTQGAEYLETNVRLLVEPRHHYSKKGYSKSRYYHGGMLPQECMLSFLQIER